MTDPRQELIDETALAAAVAKYPDFTLPDPLRRCTRCGEHAAVYRYENDQWICGPCGPRVSVFALPVRPDDLRQQAADAAMRKAGL